MGYFRFFYTDLTFYRPVTYPMNKKKLKKFFKFLFIYSKKVHGDCVKNESAIGKKIDGGAPMPV